MFSLKFLTSFLALYGPIQASAKAVDRRQCANGLSPSYAAPVIAQGWTAQLLAKGLTSPRGLVLDTDSSLLVVEQRKGITRLSFTGTGNCLTATKATVISQNDLTHGIALSVDNTTLYASSAEAVYAWPYSPSTGTTTGDRTTLIANMTNADHVSRTLTTSKKAPGTLLVSRGSAENLDAGTQDLASGRSQVRAFDVVSGPGGVGGNVYDFASEGRVLGWGLRNSVGVAEHPATGGIWTVENSVDQLSREGTDIHVDNPGEEMNYLGALGDAVPEQPRNYGYPVCVSLWSNVNVPNAQDMVTGTPITSGLNTSVTDEICGGSSFVAPRLVFQAHSAPLDIAFNPSGTEAFVTFHGSWNRSPPSGYRMGTIAFDSNGEPTAASTSTTALQDVLSPADINNCPSQCARPVGLALDGEGRVFMSSDTTGEIWVLQRTEL